LQRDPAARGTWDILTCYPGLHAVTIHRISHWFWNVQLRWIARFTAHLSRWLTGIEIHPGATIGRRVFIDHGMGVVIGETTIVGDDCIIYQGVTLGGTALTRGAKRHPTLGEKVVIGSGAKILGSFTVGAGAKVGANAVVTKAVPPGATAAGNPAQLAMQKSLATGYRTSSDVDRRDTQHATERNLIDAALKRDMRSLEELAEIFTELLGAVDKHPEMGIHLERIRQQRAVASLTE
jgi:serine O-acetyltransferase